MRNSLIILCTVLTVLAAFVIYIVLQPAPAERTAPSTAPAVTDTQRPGDQEAIGAYSAGESAWVERYDVKTGRLDTRFRAAKYTPKKDGSVFVEKPEAEFVLGDGQILRVVGVSGSVVIPESGVNRNRGPIRGPGQLPTRGRLDSVRLLLFASEKAASLNQFSIEAEINNIAFDNDTLRMHTESYVGADGKVVPAEEVPVVVRGDYEFEGYGLDLRWNQRDQRLQRLRINRGKRLFIRQSDVAAFPSARADQPAPDAHRAFAAAMPLNSFAWRGRLKSVLPHRAILSVDREMFAALEVAPPIGHAIYRATFTNDVRVTQSSGESIVADEMQIDFAQAGEGASSGDSSTRPSTNPDASTRPSPGANASPTSQPAANDEATGGSKAVQRAATTAPTTNQSREITITWDGPLEIVPSEDVANPAPAPGEAVVRLRGEPVVALGEGSRVEASLIIYQTGARKLWLEGSVDRPVQLDDARGSKVRTVAMTYFADDRLVRLTGSSRFELPIESEGGGPPQQLVASWKQACDLRLASDDLGKLEVKFADLSGEVVIEHPELRLGADALTIGFASDAVGGDAASLDTLLAKGNVDCLLGFEAQRRRIECDELSLDRPVGESKQRIVLATGHVLAGDGKDELAADSMRITLVPESAAAQSYRLDQLHATGKVRVTTADGVVASGDSLKVTGPEDEQIVELTGESGAYVTREQTTLIGAKLRLDPARQRADVLGAGSLRATQLNEAGEGRPLDLAWSKKMEIDVENNVVLVTGDVVATTPSSDGSMSTVTSQKATLLLEPAPTSRAAKPEPAARDAKLAFSDVTVRHAIVEDGVEVRSVLNDANGTLLRRVNLLAERVEYDVVRQTMIVPVPGRMLYEDRRPTAEKKPADAQPEPRGATAISWEKRLIYDPEARQARLYGDIIVIYEPQADDVPPMRLNAELLIAKFAAVSTAADGSVRAELESLHADGDIRFAARKINFEAATVNFDVASQVLTARGSQKAPAMMYDDNWLSKGTFSELMWNLRTEQLDRMTDFRATARPESGGLID